MDLNNTASIIDRRGVEGWIFIQGFKKQRITHANYYGGSRCALLTVKGYSWNSFFVVFFLIDTLSCIVPFGM